MDQTVIDLSGVPEADVGDTVTLIGEQEGEAITAREFAFSSHQIPWEAFCAITDRVARFYKTDTAL
jgi:alanine racemase